MKYYNIINEICRLVDETHEWSSTILLPDGDKYIDISSAAMGKASVTLANATKQPDVYPKGKAASVYHFDLDIYDEKSWMKLKSTLTQVGCVIKWIDWCCVTRIRELLNIRIHVTNFGALTDHYFRTKGLPTM
jgi:hypothetical protein